MCYFAENLFAFYFILFFMFVCFVPPHLVHLVHKTEFALPKCNFVQELFFGLDFSVV